MNTYAIASRAMGFTIMLKIAETLAKNHTNVTPRDRRLYGQSSAGYATSNGVLPRRCKPVDRIEYEHSEGTYKAIS